MSKKEKETQYLSLKALFETNSVKRMKDIEELFPTMIAKDLRLNHSRYIAKLYHPEDFSLKQIVRLAELIGIDVQVLLQIIIREYTLSLKKSTTVAKKK